LAIGRASPTPSPAAAACSVTYARQSEWSGGFVAQITIGNLGSAAVDGWRLAFTFPGDQIIGNAWNAAISQSGGAVTATNVAYNRQIAPGGSVSFGFQGGWQASDGNPTTFTLNGSACGLG
jgi:cellulase/cellobiase CelA1